MKILRKMYLVKFFLAIGVDQSTTYSYTENWPRRKCLLELLKLLGEYLRWDLIFGKVTDNVFPVCNSVENSITWIGVFQKVALFETLRNSLLTRLSGLPYKLQRY